MTTKAIVNYHIHKPQRQALELDAQGIVGNLVSPELAGTEICVRAVRTADTNTSFEQESVEFAEFHTDVDVLNDDLEWRPNYEADITRFLKGRLDIDEVIIFDHTLRVDDETPDELTFFNIFDNRGLPSIAHSALDMIENPLKHTVRKSIESRTLVRYRD